MLKLYIVFSNKVYNVSPNIKNRLHPLRRLKQINLSVSFTMKKLGIT